MSDELITIVKAYLSLIMVTKDYHRQNAELVAILHEAERVLVRLLTRLERSKRRFVVAIVGLTNVGKSTLLNSLLQGNLAPTRNGPCTSAPIEFVHGDHLHVVAHHGKRIETTRLICDTHDDVRKRLEELAASDSAVEKVVVTSPQPLLEHGLILADTPGFGAVQIGAAQGTHQERLKAYLRSEIAQVFWVVSATKTIGGTEQSFYDQFFSEICDDLIVTGCEDYDTNDENKFKRRFSGLFSHGTQYHFVSGKKPAAALQQAKLSEQESSGIPDLAARIRGVAAPDGRVQVIADNLLSLSGDLMSRLAAYRRLNPRAPKLTWVNYGWLNWKKVHAENELKRKLNAVLGE